MANSARIDELRKKFDENPRRYFAPLANEYRKSGDLAQAVFILEEYLPQQPGHISGHIVYGQTLFELGRDEEAKRVFETALSLDPENLIALRHLGHISRQAGDFDAARSWYQRLLEADPRDAEIEQLLGSLDAAAQAHAAGLARPSVDAPPLPPPMQQADDSPLQVEHLVQQDAPGAPLRAETHPLAPPPLPFTPQAQTPPAAAEEPPPLPESAATPDEPQLAEAEANEELLDLNDFSFDMPQAASAATRLPEPSSVVADSATADDGTEDASAASSDAHATWDAEELSPSAPAVEASASEEAAEPLPPDVPVGFEPFSGLESPAAERESDDVDGLETYTFESPNGPVADASEDVGSFYMMEPTYPTPEPAESIEPAAVVDSIDEDFASEAATEPAEAESHERFEDHAEDVGEFRAPSAIDETEEADVAGQATMPISSTPIATTPVASRTPNTAATVADASPTDAESDAFATETMAKLYLRQGHLESALGIYRTLASKHPDDETLRRRVEEIEDRVQRRRREPTPPTMIESAASDSPAGGAAAVAPEMAAVARPAGPTIREFLLGILRRGAGGQTTTNGGSIDALFDAEDTLGDDLAAADTLAQAFAPETDRDAMRGNPAREASTELSLDRVFRQPTPAHAGEAGAAGFSFDQFFAGERAEDSGPSPAETPGDPEDIEQFNAWLNGLKKS